MTSRRVPNQRAIIDRRAIAERVSALAESGDSARPEIVQALRDALDAGRSELAQRLLDKPSAGHGEALYRADAAKPAPPQALAAF